MDKKIKGYKTLSTFQFKEGVNMAKIVKFEDLKNKDESITAKKNVDVKLSKQDILEAEKNLLCDDVEFLHKIFLKEM